MLSPSHEALVDDLGGIVSAGVDVDAFLDRRVRASAERLSDFVATGLDHWLRRHSCLLGCHLFGRLLISSLALRSRPVGMSSAGSATRRRAQGWLDRRWQLSLRS